MSGPVSSYPPTAFSRVVIRALVTLLFQCLGRDLRREIVYGAMQYYIHGKHPVCVEAKGLFSPDWKYPTKSVGLK